MKSIILCDFDGTIINEDSAVLVLEQFASGNWREYDDLLAADEITLEECLKRQFSTVTLSKDEISKFLRTKLTFRVGFPGFVKSCLANGIPLVIVSAGIEFIINDYLKKFGMDSIPVVAAQISFHSKGYSFRFPLLKSQKSKNFKDDLVKQYQLKNYQVTFIGDGIGDYYAIKCADKGYVVRHSILERFCDRNRISYQSFSTFSEIKL